MDGVDLISNSNQKHERTASSALESVKFWPLQPPTTTKHEQEGEMGGASTSQKVYLLNTSGIYAKFTTLQNLCCFQYFTILENECTRTGYLTDQ